MLIRNNKYVIGIVIGIDIGSRVMGVSIITEYLKKRGLVEIHKVAVIDLGGNSISIEHQCANIVSMLDILLFESAKYGSVIRVSIESMAHSRSVRCVSLSMACVTFFTMNYIPVVLVPPCRRVGFNKCLRGWDRKEEVQRICSKVIKKEFLNILNSLNTPKPKEDVFDAISIAITNVYNINRPPNTFKPKMTWII